jgi:hypothetical protein
VHHYDTVLMNKIIDPHYFIKEKEKRRLLKEIKKFENEYSIPNFLNKLDLECQERKYIEADRKHSKNDIGARSYDG